ncbi:zinc finger protein ZAT5-like [Phalaenopsis equestris]|uniref:zinc finger protein ZAT5-like n=1 Tax=Phalaenopsis equestris TaxID=78828 RepID=UPI0009E1C3C7|nr:zinc finger protein ZAT5-like [Phalaenopsis equestris]
MEPKKIDPEQKYQCRICNKGFSWRREYEEHIRTHGFEDETVIEKEERMPTAVAGGDFALDMPTYNRELLPWNSHFKPDYSSSSIAAAASGNDDDGRDGLTPPSPPCPSYKGKRIERDRENCGSTDRQTPSRTQEEDVARFLVELSKAFLERAPVSNQSHPAGYECDNCKKVFPSHQALGGHRATHKKVKGCSAVSLEIRSAGTNNKQIRNQNNNVDNQYNKASSSSENMALPIVPLAEYPPRRPLSPRKYPKPHICKECLRQFSTGQALGGHMRCHRKPSNITATVTEAAVAVNQTIAAAPTTEVEVGAGSSEVNAVQPRSPTLVPLLSNRSYRNIDLNVEPESSEDMDGSPLRL